MGSFATTICYQETRDLDHILKRDLLHTLALLGPMSRNAIQGARNHLLKRAQVASLGWVSPGSATEGVTPIFAEKLATF